MNLLFIILGAALAATPVVVAFAFVAKDLGLRSMFAALGFTAAMLVLVVGGAFLIATGVGAL